MPIHKLAMGPIALNVVAAEPAVMFVEYQAKILVEDNQHNLPHH